MRQRLTDLHHAGLSTIQNPSALFFCAKAKHQQQLRRGVIDNKKSAPVLKIKDENAIAFRGTTFVCHRAQLINPLIARGNGYVVITAQK